MNDRPVVLLAGFEPFGGETINPSWEAVRALDGQPSGDAVVAARQMPCVFGAAIEALEAAIAETRPTLVVCVGQAGGRSEMSIERVAINVDDGRIADNAGAQPIDTPVVRDGPAAYFSTLPIKAIVHALRDAGVPASVSNTAGTFVCNHIFYGLMHALARRGDGTRGGFIHIPYLPEQAARAAGDAPSMALPTLVHGLRIAIETALAVQVDLRETGGRIS
ncbi:MAG: pyroglutamyl-peptidase I [Proteobacteria bacterium]|nr:pyroglutamyl-peptidase I [Pseudomonadota bacterium]